MSKPQPQPQPEPERTPYPLPRPGRYPWDPTPAGPIEPRHHATTIDPAAHTLAHPRPQADCPWCPPTACRLCGPWVVCPDPVGHRRQHAGSEAYLLTLAGAR